MAGAIFRKWDQMMRRGAILIAYLVLLGACLADSSTVELSSLGYTLEEVARGRVDIKDASGTTLVGGVMGIQLEGNYVYGWSNKGYEGSLEFFLISLKDNTVEKFGDDMDRLNKKLSSLGLRRSSMKDEITYWDIKKIGAKSVSEYLSSTQQK